MVRSNGKRVNTRDLFSKGFRKHGAEHLSTYLQVFKVGDYVDIRVNPGCMKGIPHKFYHGRTGRVFDISRFSVGVEVSKTVGNKIVLKRFHIRVEHLKKSRCNEDFLKRVKLNQKLSLEAKKKGEKHAPVKRQPLQPKEAHYVEAKSMELVEPIPYKFII